MSVIKLDKNHAVDIQNLFGSPKFMSVETTKNYFIGPNENFNDFYHRAFVETYLSGLKNYHAYGFINSEGHISSLLAFYESIDDASWYWNTIRTTGNNKSEIRCLLDSVLAHNEENGIYKFYSMFPRKYVDVYRRLAFSKDAHERYDYFDEYWVEAKHQCRFTLAWQILYTRTLLPVDTVVRCTFLKQQYRNISNQSRL
jgi:hypothetical protein